MKSVIKKPRNFQSRILSRACRSKLSLEIAGMASANGDLEGPELACDPNSSLNNKSVHAAMNEDTKSVCKTLENGNTEFPFAFEDLQICKEDSREMRQLKELLLLHLDLIQKQQEMLMVKDREIRTLKTDKNALRCRLERMERRMSLLRQKEVQQSPPVASVRSEPRPTVTAEESRGVKRRLTLEPQNLSKRFQSSITTSPHSASQWNVGGRSHDQGSDTDSVSRSRGTRSKNNNNESKTRPGSQSENRSERKRRPYRTGQKPKTKTASSKHRVNKDDKILRTDVMYYVPPMDDIDDGDDDDQSSEPPCRPTTDKSELEVPCWRVRVYPRAYTIEGTEDLDDNLFGRRHSKPEYEEKRRKRWDAQRIREQQVIENLKCGRGSSTGAGTRSQHGDNDSCSFLPEPESIKYIEVCDRVPVTGFGYPIPSLKPSEFELPWFDAEKRDKKDHRKSVGDSRRR